MKKYVQGCDICQRNKSSHLLTQGLLQPNEVPLGPWEIITMDIISQLLELLDIYQYLKTVILNVIDRFSKRAYFFIIDNHITTTDIAIILYD